jgi:hypothetical protein
MCRGTQVEVVSVSVWLRLRRYVEIVQVTDNIFWIDDLLEAADEKREIDVDIKSKCLKILTCL